MNETLTALAVDYGWGCPTCKGTGEVHAVETKVDVEGYTRNEYIGSDSCLGCDGNRVTPSDAEEFERLVVKVVQAALPFQKYAERGPMDLFAALDSLQRKAT